MGGAGFKVCRAYHYNQQPVSFHSWTIGVLYENLLWARYKETHHLSKHGIHLRLVSRGEQLSDATGVGDTLRHAALQRGGLAHQCCAQRRVAAAAGRAAQHGLQYVRVLRHVLQAALQLHRFAPLSLCNSTQLFVDLGLFITSLQHLQERREQ
ncbi:hypothetical protein HW555_011140 [Spodoptera exigua]|uniref:Uncharacterized protein n=1 Tax=Spodoptera exigua TaxID=7107 RepID=A0A835G8B9_SPOEX|nr:hypothetical protein HW555_011140 [Spodoptera exigua]